MGHRYTTVVHLQVKDIVIFIFLFTFCIYLLCHTTSGQYGSTHTSGPKIPSRMFSEQSGIPERRQCAERRPSQRGTSGRSGSAVYYTFHTQNGTDGPTAAEPSSPRRESQAARGVWPQPSSPGDHRRRRSAAAAATGHLSRLATHRHKQ